MEFLINQLPKLEKIADELVDAIKRENIKDERVVAVYSKIFTFHNNSLELIRKIMVYFPPEGIDNQNEVTDLYLKLASHKQKEAIYLLSTLVEEQEDDRGKEEKREAGNTATRDGNGAHSS